MADVRLTIGLDASAYSEFKKGIDDIVKQINSDPPKIKVKFDDKNMDAMRKQIEMLTKSQKDLADASKASKNIEIGSTQQYNALRQVNNALTQVTLNTQKWTAAQRGQTSGSYSEYSNQATALRGLVTELENGSITMDEFSNKFAQIRASMAETSGTMKIAGEATGAMTSSLSQAAANIVKFIGVYRLISGSIRIFKEMASVSMEIESAMAQIQVVTGATGAELEGFFQTSTSLAKGLGQSITEVAKSVETFSRLGFKLEDASALAEYATVLSNVADTDIDAATTGMTSIIKGYDMDVSNAEHVADVLTKVGQAYAISAEELMTAFERGGASLYAQGTSFEKSAALFAATNASLQNAQKVGTLWNTVAARITGSITELEEMGEDTSDLADGFSKYRDELLALTGVDIQKSTGEFRDMYDIFVDLAAVWDDLRSDQARSRVGEIFGGTRNRAGIMSTITNIKDAIDAYDDAMNSAGIAMQANDIIMETTEKHIEQMKVSFQELSANLISSDAVKGFVDLGNGFLQLLNNIQELTAGFGGLPTVIGAVTVAISALRGGSVLGGIGNLFQNAITGITGLGAANATLIGTLSAVAPAVIAVVGAISAAVSIFNLAKQAQEEHFKALKEAVESYEADTGKIDEYKAKILELREALDSGTLSDADAYEAKKQLIDIQNQLFASYGDQVSGIDLVNGKLKEQIDILQNLTKTEANELLNRVKSEYGSVESIEEKLFGTFGGEAHGIFEGGTFIGEYAKTAYEDYQELESILDDFTNIAVDDLGENVRLRYIGSVQDANIEMDSILTKLRTSADSLGGDNVLNKVFGDLSKVKDDAAEVYDTYHNIYEQVKEAQHIVELSDDTTLYGFGGDEKHTAVDWLDKYSKAVDAYNKAIVFGDNEAIKEAQREYQTLSSILDKMVSDYGFEAYAGDIEEIRGNLNEATKAQEDFNEAVKKSPSFKQARDAIKSAGLTATQIKDAYYFPVTSDHKLSMIEGESEVNKNTQAVQDLVTSLINIGKLGEDFSEDEFDSVLGWLTDVGVVLPDVTEKSKEAGEAAEDVEEALTLKGLQDTGSDFQKAINDYIKNLDKLKDYRDKIKEGTLSDDDIFSMKQLFPELYGVRDKDLGDAVDSLMETNLSNVQDYIFGLRDKTHVLDIKKYLKSVWKDINEAYSSPEETENPLKGTIEDFYDILKNEDFNKSVENVTSNIDKVKSAMDKLKEGDYSKAEFYEDFVSQFPGMEQYVDNMDAGLEELFNQLMYGGSLVGDTGSLTGIFNTKLEELSKVSPEAASALRDWLTAIQESYIEVEEASSAIDTLKESLSGFTTYQSNVSNALKASTSAVGLTTEEIMNLVDAYKDIDSFDAAKLFQSTGDGVRINAEELERLNAIIERNTLTDLYHNLADARQRLADAQANGDDTTGLENDIATAQALIAQYEGMTSAYNTWLQAKSAGGERDSYEAIGQAYNEMEKIYNAGWYDDPALQEYLNLLLGDNRTGNAVEDWGRLSATIGDTGKSLMDFWQYGEDNELVTDGLFDLLDVIHDYDDSIVEAGKDGKYNFNLTADNIERVADYLGTSPEMVRRFARALDDVGEVNIVDSVVDDLETAQTAVDRIGQIIGEATAQNPEIDIKTVVENSEEIQTLAQEIANLPPEVQTEIGVTTVGDIDGITKQIAENPESIGISVNYEGEKTEFDNGTQTINVTYEGVKSTFDTATQPISVTYSGLKDSLSPLYQTVYVTEVKQSKAAGTLSRAFANGSAYNVANLRRAYANGKVALSQNETALVNELGTESIIRDGNWFLLPRGMHQEALKKGDIILSAAQTKALINTGSAPGHGHAYAYGSLGHAYAESYFGSGLQRRQGSGNSGGSSGSSGGNGGSGNSGGSNTSSGNGSDSSSDTKKDSKEIFDWIEVRIDRIERKIKNLGITAQSTFQILTARLKASDDEINQVHKEITNQNRGYTRYIKEANKVGLSKAWRKRVQNGAIDIDTIKDEKLAEKIKDYQKWYEKALDCRDAVKELKEQLGELYQEQFDTIATDYENKLSQIEHKTNTYNNAIDNLEAHGYLRTTKYYEQLRSVEQTNLSTLQEERDALTASLNKALASGYIKEGSESYYEMLGQINDVNEAIQESETSIVEFGNSIREVEWEHFDYLQEQISNITKEAEFLINLMDDSDLFQDNGQLTNEGMATMGLHAQNYDVYMAQAAKYAEELRKIESDIAKDKNNTKLLERRQELLEAQRDSILAAEDEKQAIRDMVEEGINTELDALQKLIDKYNDALDSAKDLNDYQKKVRDQAGEVAKLEKQLSAYSGDTSEENRSRLQKLRNDLADARESLQESEQERYISEQKKLFSNLYDEYEATLNKRLDNIDQLMIDMQAKVDANAKTISETLREEATSVGYTITSNENSIWSSTGSGFSLLSTVNSTISAIASNVAAMVAKSNDIASGRAGAGAGSATESGQQTAQSNSDNDQNEEKSMQEMMRKNQILDSIKSGKKRSKTITEAERKKHHALWEYIVRNYGYAPTNNIYRNIASALGISVSEKPTSKQKNNILKALKAKGFASGAKRITTNGMFWTNEDGTETLVRKSDHAILTKIGQGDRMYNAMASENLWNAANNPGDFIVENLSKMSKTPGGLAGMNIGSVNYEVNIPIEHVGDYNDFMNQLKKDGQFEKFIQSMTVDRLAGRSKLAKNKFQW